jgi:hypothetical protein
MPTKGSTFQKKWRQKGVIKITTEKQHLRLSANSKLIYTECRVHIKYCFQQFLYCCMTICYYGTVFTGLVMEYFSLSYSAMM